ncbi:hypothetical protein AB0D67_38320 [Streptosporangium sp. NPDC048047]|uniref:hypothetical protein n=1 Tax=Streptosporangium sp. NPDC048047 TaxID=3155748 RepID=UPI00341867CF
MKDVSVIIVGGAVTVAILGIIGYAAVKLSAAAPKRTVAILLAFAVVLGAIPAILLALYGFSQV